METLSFLLKGNCNCFPPSSDSFYYWGGKVTVTIFLSFEDGFFVDYHRPIKEKESLGGGS
jgi:hypothetical protein